MAAAVKPRVGGPGGQDRGTEDIYLDGHDAVRALDPNDPKIKNRPQNIIVTSRFTIFTFLPKSIFEQFRRLGNIYFLVLGIIALIGVETGAYAAAVEPQGILAPVGVVIFISIVKEAVEDFNRHRTDRQTNARPAKIVVPSVDASPDPSRVAIETVRTVEWKDIKTGDVILLQGDDEIPADILLLACGGVQGNVAYVETAAIDGESNLKLKHPSLSLAEALERSSGGNNNNVDYNVTVNQARTEVIGLERLRRRLRLQVEPPNEFIYTFNGLLEISKPNVNTSAQHNPLQSSETSSNSATKPLSIPLSEKNVLLRGSVLRATEWCVGIVTYIGPDTKLSLNSKSPPSKLSSVDRVVNRTLFIAIATMIAVCIISMIMGIVWFNAHPNADYLCLEPNSLSYFGAGGCTTGAPTPELTIFTFATLYNNFVCISMYVSLEMIYLCQAFFLSNDLTLYDASTDTPAECHSSSMCADLGQVQYVMSDKTGTLTKNIQKLRRCSVLGKIYGAPIDPPNVNQVNAALVAGLDGLDGLVGNPLSLTAGMGNHTGVRPTFTEASYTKSVYGDALGQLYLYNNARNSNNNNAVNVNSNANTNNTVGQPFAMDDSPNAADTGTAIEAAGMSDSTSGAGAATVLSASRLSGLSNLNLTSSSLQPLRPWVPLPMLHPASLPPSASAADRAVVEDFLSVLVACNTVILLPDAQGNVNVTDATSLEAYLQAESADEVALVSAAANHFGVLLTARSDASTRVRGLVSLLPDSAEETIELLGVNEFDSDRKRMSVLCRRKGGRHVLLCKGADSSMLAPTVCKPGEHTAQCAEHIDHFASAGLRTLVAAKREISEAEAVAWLKDYNAAKSTVVQRQERLVQCALAIEKDMDLLGCVGVEDELQDEAPQSIQILRDAGINVWMITGDKAETAIAIGKMCALVSDAHIVERVVALSGDLLSQRLVDLKEFIDTHVVNKSSGNSNNASSNNDANNNGVINMLAGLTGSPRFQSRQTQGASGRSNIALVIDGTSLEGIFKSPDLKLLFAKIVQHIPTVIACRVSPLQKAALVRMIKTSPLQPITLAIGDGANDVGMIHEARVGVGISGKEGRHAANSADFAISQFRFLVPLLMEHGRFNYIRCSKLVLYSFFKNLLLVSCLFYFCLYSGFSGTVPLDSIVFSGFNFYLGLPIIALGAFDFDIPRKFVYVYPALAYQTGRLGELLNAQNMLRWCSFAFLQGLFAFLLCLRIIGGALTDSAPLSDSFTLIPVSGLGLQDSSGRQVGLFGAGFLIYTTIVISMQYKVMAITDTKTWINWGLTVISVLGYFLFNFIYGLIPSLDWYNVMANTFSVTEFWVAIICVPIFIHLSDEFVERMFSMFAPSSLDTIKALYESDHRKQKFVNLRSVSVTSRYGRSDGKAGSVTMKKLLS